MNLLRGVGVVSVLTACGISLNPQQIEAIITVGLMIVGLIGTLTQDNANAVSAARQFNSSNNATVGRAVEVSSGTGSNGV